MTGLLATFLLATAAGRGPEVGQAPADCWAAEDGKERPVLICTPPGQGPPVGRLKGTISVPIPADLTLYAPVPELES